MSKFCKIFETVKHGQILAMISRGEENGEPIIQWTINMGDFHTFGVDVIYPNTPEGWQLAKDILDDLNTEMAYRVADVIINMYKEE